MGTSTARRGPSTVAWRLAKRAATRYLAPEGAPSVEAREVVRRYVAALQETTAAQGQDLLAEFRLTRKAAQSLGEFGDLVAGTGWAAALEAWGRQNLAVLPPEEAILGLTSVWVEGHGSLEAAVARTALATCLGEVLASGNSGASIRVDGFFLVRAYLANAFCQRLALDLGESLEAAAACWPQYQKGLARLQEELMVAATEIPADPPATGHWQGLAGWVFVTEVLEKILQRFQDNSL